MTKEQAGQLIIQGGKNQSKVLKNYWNSLLKHFGIKRVLLWLVESIFNMILSPWPILGGSFIRRLGYWLLLKKVGKGLVTAPGVKFLHAYNITIGDRCSLNYDTILNGRGGLTIGNDFTSGPGCIIWTVEHYYESRDCKVLEQGEYDSPVVIGNDVWLGMRTLVLPGVKIADGTVAAAGSVIVQNTEPYSVVAGVPAKIIKYRTSGIQRT